MKTLIAISISIFILSCGKINKVDNSDMDKLFDPAFDLTTADLKSRGYNFVKDWSWYQKSNGDTAFIYHAQEDADPIFSRIVSVGNWQLRDSVEIRKFIELKNGKVVSPFYEHDDALEFFVQGQRSGLYSKCVVGGEHLQILFQYPDHGGVIRSKFRKPTTDGFVTEFGEGNQKQSFKIN